jgi:hypothetical protein
MHERRAPTRAPAVPFLNPTACRTPSVLRRGVVRSAMQAERDNPAVRRSSDVGRLGDLAEHAQEERGEDDLAGGESRMAASRRGAGLGERGRASPPYPQARSAEDP